MKAIFIAAGEGSRMGHLTEEIPKPLVDVNGRSIIERKLDLLKNNKITDITIITGPYQEKFNFKNVNYVNDKKFKEHDQLGSLMIARDNICDDVIILFADIIFEESILQQILESKAEISLAVDLDWEKSYMNRPNNPFEGADKVRIESGKATRIFKNEKNDDKNFSIGEFIGLMKLTKTGAKKFVDAYNELESTHSGRFHDAESLQKAKLIDLLQELIEQRVEISTTPITGKWCEIDTEQDLQIAKNIFQN